MILEISISVAALAFVVLTVYIISLIQRVKTTLQNTEEALMDIRKQADRIVKDSEALIKSTHEMTDQLNQKLKSFDSLFHSVKNIGEAVNQTSTSFKEASAAVTQTMKSGVRETVHKRGGAIVETLKWLQHTLDVWNAWKSQKAAKKDGSQK